MLNEGWALFCVVGFWGWVLSTIGFIFKTFPARGVFSPRPAAFWGGGVLICFLIWVVGMINA